VAQPGDRICTKCHEANDPSRQFCRRCGTSLAAAAVSVAALLPWWRRIFRRSEPKPLEAGQRTADMRPADESGLKIEPRTLVVGALIIAVVVGAIAIIAVPSLRDSVTDTGAGIVKQVQRIVAPSLEIVHPITAGASSQVEEHGPGKLIDTFSNTEWQSREVAPSVTLTFQELLDLGAVIVHNGSATSFVDLRRPARLRFTFPDGSMKEIDLVDDHKPQEFDVSANEIGEITITVLATNGPAGTPLALAEIEFFRTR
jgi:hypothetical protein